MLVVDSKANISGYTKATSSKDKEFKSSEEEDYAYTFCTGGFMALFMRLAPWNKCKFNFKIESNGIIYVFKNYFAKIF